MRCNGMPCEDKAYTEDLMMLLQDELTNSTYQSPESVRVKTIIEFSWVYFISENTY